MICTIQDARLAAYFEGRHHHRHVESLMASPVFASGRGAVMLRLLHAAPHTENIDVAVNGMMIFRNVSYRELSSYVRLPGGSLQIAIFKTGSFRRPLFTAYVHVMPGGYYTIAAAGTARQLFPVSVSDHKAADPDIRSMRFVHLSPDAPALDLAVRNGPVLFADIPFAKASRHVALASQKIDLDIRAAGTNTVLLNVPKLQLEAGRHVNLFCLGFANGAPSLEVKEA
ncbi:DUF4397 domain-containing protein [Bacillus swezeyi]|uniref:DUF4397 domain-containing protein n=1 Tax=Bacillus swezeyi TaxID=1925020 RepID=A0A1R1RLQ0_9BACI|nr:DUF4397 domain-containing protein [Bacillus swezeyi]MEC1260034.1 DUF4397 domain-containing protein [Bacillus swezeyi]MED2929734.1 DUF4397 domain-containing protein [Bacillus swezeyi]MED2943517.1 DUF4397 domain-containing protein [Bacillus swezeyi]MED2963239.1 DUF4397 domain-containing protein [Bacillus swezeyi]MED3073190.1 DUF4397 domain-containing protein [Bacillus swezeyi]